MTISKVNEQFLFDVIEKCEPVGKFYAEIGNCQFVAIDNSAGEAWTEEFSSLNECVQWLNEM